VAAFGSWAFGGEPPSVRGARQFTAGVCVSLEGPHRDDVLLCVSELVTNVVMHAHSAGELRITVRSDGVRIEVDDGSTEAPALPAVDPSVGGRGLRIVDRLVASWGHAARAGGKTVWAELPATPVALPGGPSLR
jgi:anti-sigma regulatory factor (Ser/Thr protein kinase)